MGGAEGGGEVRRSREREIGGLFGVLDGSRYMMVDLLANRIEFALLSSSSLLPISTPSTKSKSTRS